jgi:biotin carboxyl carrier protein
MIRRYSVTVAGETRAVEVQDGGNGATVVRVDGREHRLELRPGAGPLGWREGAEVVEAFVDGGLPKVTVGLRGMTVPVEVVDARASAAAAVLRDRKGASGPLTVRAPMPGRVVRVLVKVGEAVTAGKGVAVVEAMKMENEIRAPRDGKVQEVTCTEGGTVDAGQTLVILA